jgi:hypothetical protein
LLSRSAYAGWNVFQVPGESGRRMVLCKTQIGTRVDNGISSSWGAVVTLASLRCRAFRTAWTSF